MSDVSIQQVSPNTTALNAEHYQTFEMAKANDDILGGDNIAQIRSYAAYARAQAQAIHKTIAATNGLDDVAAIKAEATETAQTFAKVGIYADQRIGEILRELPKSNKWASNSDTQEVETKADALKESGISKSQAYDLQAMAANPEVVEAVIAKATEEGRVVSRKKVLDAINEKKRAERELRQASIEMTDAKMEAESLKKQVSDARAEIAALEKQNDELYAQKNPEPEVVTREVVPKDVQRRIESLERENRRLNDEYQQMWQKKREADAKLDQANELLGEKGKDRDAQRDIEYLTAQVNGLLRQHGGKAWAFDQFYRVDELTQREFEKAITNLASFAQNMVALIADRKQIGA